MNDNQASPDDFDGPASKEAEVCNWRQGHGRVPSPKVEYPDLPKPKRHSWKTRLAYLLRAHGHKKVRGRGRASNRTIEVRNECLFRDIKMLREAGYKIEDPANLDARHIRFLFGEWERRRKLHEAGEPDGMGPATLANEVSVLRTFCGWIDQPQLLDHVQFNIANPVSRVRAAQVDKTWEGNGIDALQVVERAWESEPWVAVAVLLQYTLGLRQKEAAMFQPFVAHRPGEAVVMLNMARGGTGGRAGPKSAGTKGGRARVIALVVPWEHQVLDFAREFVCLHTDAKNRTIGPVARLETNLAHYHDVLRELGITKAQAGATGHGLRAEFVFRRLHRYGLEAPVRGGDLKAIDPKRRDLILRLISEDLGHSRASITSSYYGSVNQRGDVKMVHFDVDEKIAPRIADLLQKLREKLAHLQKIERGMRSYERAVQKR